MRRLYAGDDPDCFWNLGGFQVCDATQNLSIYSSLFLLMTQALFSRFLVPGISNFVNASVGGLRHQQHASFVIDDAHFVPCNLCVAAI
jgi:hypothetical protein